VLVNQHRFDEAIAHCERALQIRPDDPAAQETHAALRTLKAP
jgi:Flp pilus assembly protein TadD